MVSLGHKVTHLGNWQLAIGTCSEGDFYLGLHLIRTHKRTCTCKHNSCIYIFLALTSTPRLPTLPIEYGLHFLFELYNMGGQGTFRFCNLHYLHYLFIDSCNLLAHLPPCCTRANASILDHPLLPQCLQGNKLPKQNISAISNTMATMPHSDRILDTTQTTMPMNETEHFQITLVHLATCILVDTTSTQQCHQCLSALAIDNQHSNPKMLVSLL